jgi:hypothetical protein
VVQIPQPPADKREASTGLLAGLDWLDSLTLSGLDGQNLNEIGLKNGKLVVDDQQRGNTWDFNNISLGRQGLDPEYPARAAHEGSDLQRRSAVDR